MVAGEAHRGASFRNWDIIKGRKRMEPKIQVYLLDSSTNFLEMIRIELEENPDFSVIGSATDGRTAYQEIKEKKPDLLVMDLLVPYMDGQEMLRRLKKERQMPRTVVLTSFINDHVAHQVSVLGVYDFLVKSCGIHEMVSRVQEAAYLLKPRFSPDFKRIASQCLIDFCISPHLSGYQYHRESILWALKDHSILRGVTKNLYPELGKRHNTTGLCIERAMRGALVKAWKEGSSELRRKRFGTIFDQYDKAPSNVRFLTAMVEFIEMNTP